MMNIAFRRSRRRSRSRERVRWIIIF